MAQDYNLVDAVDRLLKREMREHLREHIIKVIEPDIYIMVEQIMKKYEPQIRSSIDLQQHKYFLEILIKSVKEDKDEIR